MCLLDACICIQNTHIYACFVRICMRVLYAYIYACFVRIYIYTCFVCTTHIYAFKVFSDKYYIGLEPIYHEPILKQMANHITLGNGFVNRDSTYPSSKRR